ncbi:uncharacterized protein LOC111890546 [Lactuca sativa]|uniref:uncharacterized protein LOC111890546 n=1 Tax=Lactuca sativa TaxID=4236 RepID=UPI000CD9AD68|nr:uncharacterized protein LOC111890546 [Lactuca sativa]
MEEEPEEDTEEEEEEEKEQEEEDSDAESEVISLPYIAQNLKKGKTSVSEYVATFTKKMKLVPYLVPIELSKVNKFSSGLSAYFGPTLKLTTNLKAAIWAARNIETQVRDNGLEKAEKRKLEGYSRSNTKGRFLKSGPNVKRSGGNKEAKWCDKCRKKQLGKCIKGVTCFNYGKTGHYANECTTKKEVCFKCGKEGHFNQDCLIREGAAKPNV